MKPRKFLYLAHRWLGLLLGLQVAMWMASGVVMSWFPIEWVRGETSAQELFPPALDTRGYASPGGVIAQMEGVTEVRLRPWLSRRVYEVTTFDGAALFDARTGERLSPIAKPDARRVAEQDYLGDGEIVELILMRRPPPEFRGDPPVWRASFNDSDRTRLYISPETGRIVARRNRIWRFYDFFWMLHIMDYEGRVDFNNPLLRAASATGLAFALTGLSLVVVRLFSGGIGGYLKR